MPPLSLEGDTLGEKHKYLNKLAQDAVDNKQFNLTKLNNDDSDIHNLLQIDISCKTKNVDYIIEVLKCDDMLYVSRAIKHSTWLITEQEYAHIINPEYLYTQLFPHMLTKAINKLLLHIRIYLKDEKRAELFYEYLQSESGWKDANRWLLNCSLSFVENVIQKAHKINLKLFKRLCKRSIKFLQYYKKVDHCNDRVILEKVMFLLKSHPGEFVKILQTRKEFDFPPFFTKRNTKVIMKTYPELILNNFEKYMNVVHQPIAAKYITKGDIKDLLVKWLKDMNIRINFYSIHNIQHFIRYIPKDDQFQFVKEIFIDKKAFVEELKTRTSDTPLYYWYQHASFNVAFIALKKLLRAENSPKNRCAILSVLTSCTRNNPQDINTLLQYYYDKHRNEPFKFKIQFVNGIIMETTTHDFDNETWKILDKLFHSLEVYIESDRDVQMCLKSIILYKVLHNEKVPDIVEKKISFQTFKAFHRKLTKEQQGKIFSYLLTSISHKIQNKTISNECDLTDSVELLKSALEFLKDWQRDMKEYPFVLDNIKKLLKIKKENSWTTDLSTLYHINKSCRRHMFEESVKLCPSEEVFLNTLKHDPQLLTRYSEEVNALRTDDKVSLRRFLSKLRVYWPDSLAQQWTEAYLNNINTSTGHLMKKKSGALIRGVFVLLPQNQILDIVKKYVPTDPKIDWNKIDQTKLSVVKNIGKYLHTARPLVPLDVILWYATGDYLQYTVPSLKTLLHNMSQVKSREYMSKLLEGPVSLQKYGIHLAFLKLKHEELAPIFLDIWQTTTNVTIRARLFNYIHDLLCKVPKATEAKKLWKILSVFIDGLSADDNKAIFTKLGNVKHVHISVQGNYFMRAYEFLASLPSSADCDTIKDNLIYDTPDIIELLDSHFVVDKLLTPIDEKITTFRFIGIIASYVLHGRTEDEQCERFRRVLEPALKHIILSWNSIKDNRFVMKENLDSLFRTLLCDFKRFFISKKIIIPVKLFSEIKMFMEQNMGKEENYVKYTVWKLTLEYVKLIAEYKDMLCDTKLDNVPMSAYNNCWLPEEAEEVWKTMHMKLSPELGAIFVKLLKEDTEKYFPTIHSLFSDALITFFESLYCEGHIMPMETYKYMVYNEGFIPCYLVVCEGIAKYNNNKDKRVEIRRILSAHPSPEVQTQYHRSFLYIVDEL